MTQVASSSPRGSSLPPIQSPREAAAPELLSARRVAANAKMLHEQLTRLESAETTAFKKAARIKIDAQVRQIDDANHEEAVRTARKILAALGWNVTPESRRP